MNLWVKRTGQLLLAALFLMACEDESSLLGFRNPTKKFEVNFIDVPLETSVMLLDSVRTDNQEIGTDRLLVGKYFDPVFGEVSATAFVQIRPAFSDTLPSDAAFDSLVLTLHLDKYAYGGTGLSSESFSVHEILEDSIQFSPPFQAYYPYHTLGYGPSIGEVTYTLDYDSLAKYSGSSTDTTFSVSLKLNENTDLIARLFDIVKNNPGDQFMDNKKFRYAIKGLALVPQSPANSIIGYSIQSTAGTRLTLHYHTTTDTLMRIFYLDGGSFGNITTDRVGDLAGLTQPYETIKPGSGMRYLQNGTPVITRIDLNNFYNAIADLPNTIFNKADLIIESIESPGIYTPPSTLYLRVMKENNQFYNRRIAADANALKDSWLLSDGNYYIVRSDISSATQAVPTTLNLSDNMYSGNLTLFTQDLFNKAENQTKVRYLGLYNFNIGKTVNRVVFNQSKVKLRLYYTVPIQ